VRRPWFKTEPVDESFFDAAPDRLVGVFDVSRPAAEVWAELTSDRPLAWCRVLESVKWTSPRPFGVGTKRVARSVGGLSILREHFFRWEEGRRHSFYAEETSMPMFRRIAEDYLVEPTSDGSCRFTWTIAMEPRPAARVTNPLNKRLLGTLFRDTRRHYAVD
jgi:hypothetical protein